MLEEVAKLGHKILHALKMKVNNFYYSFTLKGNIDAIL